MHLEAFMAKKNMGRPLKGEKPATQRVSALLTEDEKTKLDQIAAEKKWPIATLVKDCLEKCYPEVFGKVKPK
jgi:hypothetical protein